MKEIRIPIHSTIDVITNSSTEIFVSAASNSVEGIRDILQEIITLGGGDKKVEEIFDITLQYEEKDCYVCGGESEDLVREEGKPCPRCGTEASYGTINPTEEEADRYYSYYNCEYGLERELIIKPKNLTEKEEKEYSNIISRIFNLFEMEGINNY